MWCGRPRSTMQQASDVAGNHLEIQCGSWRINGNTSIVSMLNEEKQQVKSKRKRYCMAVYTV
jgi:frataxin-like iron-binding protein CyaY